MNPEQVKHIANIYYRKLKKHSKRITPGYETETIHQFRVEYKKLRAFLRMIPFEENEKGKIKISKKLKKVYNISGSIRDLQLQLLRIADAAKQEPGEPMVYLKLLQKKIDKLIPLFSKVLLKDPVTGSKKKTTASIRDEFSLNMFGDYVQNKMVAIRAIIATGLFNDNDIHAIRKSLKDIFYNMEIFEKVENVQLSPVKWKGKEKEYLDELLNKLGNFQDKCTAIALVGPYWLRNLNNYDLELIDRIKKLWIKEKLIMKQSLINKFQTGLVALITTV